MNQPYFIVVLAHSLHGRLRRFQIDQKVIFAVLGLALLGGFTLFGMVSSYLRMAWKVGNYNSLREETEFLRARYQKLLTEANQTNEQMARLQMFASEVSVAYGLNKRVDAAPDTGLSSVGQMPLMPTLRDTLEEYNRLKTASLGTGGRMTSRRWLVNTTPGLWPVMGRLLSSFGTREDPFFSHQAFHTGVDISSPQGTPVHVAADGIVTEASWGGAYGKLIVVDHGNGLQTYYAHLSRIDVIPNQEVRMGQVIGGTGMTGRATAPHLHYEVRRGGAPVNPHYYLEKSALATSNTTRDFGF
ncbi:M23 family metallopeptidase [Paludibaculum fermentans]|uniref:M23 family metallopeptidase n=1 Tax=Paludibaculum fermentans TaxID=1473598 RepID=A0A7S7SM81_PALFE|nr:M23 family metallopeptidase [Paludibaculum fermentans]QOY89241.1 M23 family metallopeptidase [Paludibaculum fermentans]